MRCPSCQCEIPDTSRFCGMCGSQVPPPSQRLTATASGRAAPTPIDTPAAHVRAGDSIRGFTPGAVDDGRNRVIALLGRGGRGEFYRADDLKRRTRVALKFRPAALAGDPSRLERFLAEVRLARQVAQPNVCR